MVWSKLGINFGNTSNYSYTGSNSSDLDYLKSIGINKVRMVGCVNDATQAYHRSNSILAKSKGFYVIYGTSVGWSLTLTSSNWSTYKAQVLAEAAIAEANGFDEFCFGNEEELHIDNDTIVDPYALYNTYMKPLSADIKSIYHGLVSFTISNGAESWIYSISMPNVDRLGFNCYGDKVGNTCTQSSFMSRILGVKNNAIWGNKIYISEWNTNFDGTLWTSESTKPEVMTLEIAARQAFLRDTIDRDAYFFCWSNDQSHLFSAVMENGTLGNWFNPLSTNNKRHWFINT